MTTTSWWERTALEVALAIAGGETTAVEVLESCLARIDALDGALNAVTFRCDEEARAAALAADAAVARGEVLGSLHGVPVLVKENVDVLGQPTPNGVKAFEGVIAPDDSPVVSNLRKAGAVIAGRSSTPEFSLRFHTDSLLRGPTVNPWDATRVPGGSSGGAAVAVATGMAPLAHGNDLGGSLRYPASCCGVATIRPSLGRVPAYNPSAPVERGPALQLMSVQGPIARTVADVRVGLHAMAAPDFRDPWHSPVPMRAPATRGRVLVMADPEPGGVDPRIAAAVRGAADALADAGWRVEDAVAPPVAEAASLWQTLVLTDVRATMATLMREHGSADILTAWGYIDAQAPEIDRDDYIRALGDRTRLVRQWNRELGDSDVVLGPVSCELPLKVGDDLVSSERTAEIMHNQRLMVAVNLLGLSAATVPAARVDGIPVGVQLIAGRFQEEAALLAAEDIEQHVGLLTPITPAGVTTDAG